ncbi:MAG: AsmA family protein [Rhodospirillales bacterium]|nr:AsmA family protein [Rhodospirillales bacterium]
MRIVKILGWIGGCLVLLLIAGGLALYFGGAPAVVWALEHPVSNAIGRQITVGKLTLKWGAPSQIVAEDVHVANASWGSEPDMFTAKRLEVDLFIRSLIFGPAHVPAVSVESGRLLIETSDKGEGNWKMALKSTAPQKRGQSPDLEKVTVKDSVFVYRNGETKAQSEIGVAQLQLDEKDPTAPLAVAADGTFQRQKLHIDGRFGALNELRDTTKPYPIKVNLALGDIQTTADGSIGEPMDFAGVDVKLQLKGKNLDKLGDALGVPLPEFPDFRGTTELVGGNGRWELKAIALALGKSDLEGGIAFDTTPKVPTLRANLSSKFVDLADFQGLYGAKPANSSTPKKPADPSGRVLPDTKIAIGKLPGLNADVTFDSTRIKAPGDLPIERVSLGLKLQDGTMTVQPLRFHVAQGDVDLNLSFTPFTQSGPPHLKGAIDVRHVDLHQLLRNSGSKMLTKTAGVIGGFIKLDTAGTSTREFLAAMNGDAGFFMENGQISDLLQQLAPIDVLGALGVYVTGDKPIPINCFVSRFDIKSGVATATTLLLDTPDTNISGTGNINFASETIYLSLVPRNKRLTAVSLRTPVEVKGTFSKPEFSIQAGGLAARLGAAIGLGIAFPPAALLPLIDIGLGENNACSAAYAAQKPPDDKTAKGNTPKVNPSGGDDAPSAGSSSPPKK